MGSIAFEAGLSALFRHNAGGDVLGHLALAERAGLSRGANDWLQQRLDGEPEKKVHVRWLGKKSFEEIVVLWEALRQGSSLDILNCMRASVPDKRDTVGLSLAFDSIIVPLVILGRGSTIPPLQGKLPESIGGSFAERAALGLGSSGDWDGALSVLEQAHQDGANPHINMSSQSQLWKHAYLQGLIDPVLPRLAAIPFNRELAHAAGRRAWGLVAYRIRAGDNEVQVPALTPEQQVPGYTEAAAMQIAALEGISSAAETIAELHRLLRTKPMTITLADRGLAFEIEIDELTTARVRIAARRRDYAKLAALAQAPSRSLEPVSVAVIDALIDEGDWRAAAEFAKRYDPRDQSVFEGLDDTRMHEYRLLQLILAAAAARDGDDAAAQAHLATHLEAGRAIREAERSDSDEDVADDDEEVPPGLWPTTLLAGAAEGVLPRHFIALLLPLFRAAY
jgi:hypothetical protein